MSNGVSRNVPEKKALAVAKSEKAKWDTQKEPFHTFKRRVMIWAESLKMEHLLTGPPLGDVVDFECHDAAASFRFPCQQLKQITLLTQHTYMKHGNSYLIAMSRLGQ